MKRWWILGSFIVLLAAGIIYYAIPQFEVVNDWDGNEKQVVMANKVWKVQFSEKISEKSLNSGLVYITNSRGEKVDTELSLSDDQRTVYIHPPENGYDASSEFFTVHFKEDLKSAMGKELHSAQSWQFIVKETLPVVGSQEKLASYFEEILKEQKESRGFWGGLKESFSADDTKDSGASGEKSSSESANDVSETNVQVQGVDEADIIKSDGKHIYQAEQNSVRIIEAGSGGKMKLLSTITYDQSFSPYQLFLDDQKLVVIGYQYHDFPRPYDEVAKDSKIAPMMQSTKVIVYNMKNPAKPAVIRELELEGSYVSARKVEGVVYLITSHYPDFWLLDDNREIDIRPKYSDTASGPNKKTISYDDIKYFPESREPNYTMIAAFDLDQPKKEAAITTYLGSGNQVYMSKDNLYLAISNYTGQRLEERGIVAPDTDIHKFSVEGMKVEFNSTASVPGMVLNQFSMDEHNGHFRLVTTKGYAWDETRPSANHLYILDENLKLSGKIEGLARGERIYSARFMGDRIYMVTFKETDPLFVIEASDPANPKVLGELKIPGFSNYLHPYDENHIIGFGQDTKLVAEKGSNSGPRVITNGVKISMFDVSDMSNPKEKFTEIIGGMGTHSPLNYDHKALLFNKNKNLFAFPITVYRNSEKNEYEQIFEFQGAFIYNIDPANGFKLKSKITHITGQMPVYEEWNSSIQRLLYIGDTLYALSPAKITSHDLRTYEKMGELKLGEGLK
jgi:inhibitor of cysteine peptidase